MVQIIIKKNNGLNYNKKKNNGSNYNIIKRSNGS